MPIETSSDVEFHAPSLPDAALFLVEMRGTEAISRPYRFELVVQCDAEHGLDDREIETLLRDRVYIAFDSDELRKVHGIVSECEMASVAAIKPVRYRLVIVPQLWLASQNVGSWVYQDMSVPAIVRAVLQRAGLVAEHVEFRLGMEHARLEYTVQYEETDLAFVTRLLEREGMFYYFEHGDDHEKIVFGDSNEVFRAVPDEEQIGYDPRPSNPDRRPCITSLTRRQQRTPGLVWVKDYNYRLPGTPLIAESGVHHAGRGLQIHVRDHVRTPDEAKLGARLRAQALAVERTQFRGASTVRNLYPGRKFTLHEHVFGDFDRDYVVLETTHSVAQGATESRQSEHSVAYSNAFVAIPTDAPYRPARATPVPRIDGVVYGRVDGPDGLGAAAPLDAYGRYKVIMSFDTAPDWGGSASCWIPMVQSATGPGWGAHNPLHIGTEVMIAHVNGDPDRPVIVGSVPNLATRSPAVDVNATQSVFRTRAGIQIQLEDNG